MSDGWFDYVDSLIKTSDGHCDKAAIIGLDDGLVWASRGMELELLEEEVKKISDFSTVQASGVRVEGVKYIFLRELEGIVLAKKVGHGAISIQKATKAFVIGHTKEGCQQVNTNKAVTYLAESLVSMNF